MDADRVLAFRLARSGLAARTAGSLAEAAACPASDFARHAALLALAARAEGVSREAFDRAIDTGDLVLAHVVRGAIHALAPGDLALYGRALIADDDGELAVQLGPQVRRLAATEGFAPTEALAEVAAATDEALAGGRALGKDELHEELRRRVRPAYMPWCRGCGSHHVAPMLWRYATVAVGARLDPARRYTLAATGRTPAPAPRLAPEAVRRFLGVYGPSTPGDFAAWAGLAKPHARRLWDVVAGDLAEVPVGGRRAWLLAADLPALESPPAASGVRLLPPGDPYLQKPNRPLLAPDREPQRQLFRPVASPGAVLSEGRLAGTWRAKARGKKAEITVEPLEALPGSELPRGGLGRGGLGRGELEEEARRVAALRGAADLDLVLG